MQIVEMFKRNHVFSFCILSFMLSVLGFSIPNEQLLCTGILIIILLSIFTSLNDIPNNIIYLTFNIALTLFISGKVIIDGYAGNAFESFPIEIKIHSLLCIYLSHVSLFLGYKFLKRHVSILTENKIRSFNYSNYKTALKLLIVIFSLSSLSFLIVTLEKIIFVFSKGYLSYYTDFASELPHILIRLSNLFYLTFFTIINFPLSRKYEWSIYGVFVFLSIITVFTGQRSHVALNILVLLIFIIIKYKDYLKKVYLKKVLFISFVFLILAAISLQSIQSYRNNGKIILSDLNPLSFVYTQGYTSNVIAYGKLVEDRLDNSLYSIASLKELFNNNIMVKRIFKTKSYKGNSYEIVKYESYLSYDLSYLILGENYFEGEGLGTSYIAEVYHDFSYIGLFLFGIIISYLCIIYNQFNKHGFFISCLLLLSLKYFIFLPRWDTLYFITFPFQSMNILLILFLYLIRDDKLYGAYKKIRKSRGTL